MRQFRVLAGLFLTIGGFGWLAVRLDGIGPALSFFGRWWPAAIIAVGLMNLLRLLRRPTLVLAPLAIMVVGYAALGATLHHTVPDRARPYLAPLALVGLGLTIALVDRERGEGDEQVVRQAAVLRSRRFASTSSAVRHANVRAFFGNLDLDLSRCGFRSAVEIYVTVLCGHVNLIVPPQCQVRLRPAKGLGVYTPKLPAGPPAVKGINLTVSVLGWLGGIEITPGWSSEVAIAVEEATPATQPDVEGFTAATGDPRG